MHAACFRKRPARRSTTTLDRSKERKLSTDREQVVIVLAAGGGESLASVNDDAHVWMVDSADNRQAAQLRRDRLAGGSVTTFAPQSLADLLPTIEEHHPEWRVLEVVGGERSERLEAELLAAGVTVENASATSFRVRKKRAV